MSDALVRRRRTMPSGSSTSWRATNSMTVLARPPTTRLPSGDLVVSNSSSSSKSSSSSSRRQGRRSVERFIAAVGFRGGLGRRQRPRRRFGAAGRLTVFAFTLAFGLPPRPCRTSPCSRPTRRRSEQLAGLLGGLGAHFEPVQRAFGVDVTSDGSWRGAYCPRISMKRPSAGCASRRRRRGRSVASSCRHASDGS